MPVHYQIHEAERRIRTACVGPVTLPEVCEHFGQLKDDPAFRLGLDVLLDLSPMTSTPESDQLREVVARIESLAPRRPFGACAVVASEDILFGMSRVFEIFARDVFEAVSVFRTTDEAESWLAAKRAW